MVPSDAPRSSDLDAVLAALGTLSARDMVVVAPHGTVNTGLVTGGQRQMMPAPAESGATAAPMRQGPVRAKHLRTARRCFVPPPCFREALAAIDSGVTVLVGERGTGRETHALNLLAYGREEPVLVQVDGAVSLSRWAPRAQGVHGYLVMEPPDPFALRAWDLSRLETSLAEAGARLVIVLADAPGLVGTLKDHLGIPVVRHHPPDPRKVFAAYLSDSRSEEHGHARWLRALESGRLDDLLPDGLPPRRVAQAVEAVLRMGVVGGASAGEVMRHLAQTEGPEVVARAQSDPALLAHLLSIGVYGGLHHSVVTERAGDLLRLVEPAGQPGYGAQSTVGHLAGNAPQRPLSETLRILGAHRVQNLGEDATDTVSLFWPAVSEAVWEVLCRDHPGLLPPVHTWLARSGPGMDQIERAGRALTTVAVATGGRSLDLLRDVATASPSAPEVAASCLGAAVQNPAAARAVTDLLEQWSIAPEPPLRKAVAYACHSDRGQVPEERALHLLHQLMETLDDDEDGLSVLPVIIAALVQRFEAGESRARAALLRRMRDWADPETVSGLLMAFAFPVLAGTDPAWWSDELPASVESAASAVELTGHALNEPATFAAMREVLLTWCSEADGDEHRVRALGVLMDGLVAARQPGFLRWLLAVGRGPDEMPGKEPAARALAMWRDNTCVIPSDC
ncbi:hypothetical protein JQK87_11220 [Streptomyces sp. G44]|uniref:hypothetical protein n=1 Tax=Streptomyces sp. G44 TaxID=2807632 RepID=UPI001961FE69|nr:hypothetical protein [Streptomyces sp. G44]MBM7168977.1 hypothetical protein [Streptomyces sp. G44]